MKYWLHITSGRGPIECCFFVEKIVPVIKKEAKKENINIEILEAIPFENNTLKSVLLSLEGDNIDRFSEKWNGTLQLIWNSKFRTKHKRKNWFISVELIKPIEDNVFSDKEIIIETMRSSGAGGQHVNKTESAIRIKHIATGIVVSAQEERSQYQNKKLALSRLQIALEQKSNNLKNEIKQGIWENHNDLIRGNPVRTFIGETMQEKLI